MAVAALAESPGRGRSWCRRPLSGCHTTARNPSTCGALHVGSWTAVSAQPTTYPRLFTSVPKLLSPPSVGIAIIRPLCHAKPRQIWPVIVGKNAEQLQCSPSGDSSAVSANPTTVLSLLSPGHPTWLFGPPSVPRDVT